LRKLPTQRNENFVNSNFTQIIGLAAGICTSTSLLPQLIKLIKNKKAEDISLFYLIILFIGLALWTVYGILRNDLPIIATNGFSVLVNSIIIILGIKYKKAQGNPLAS
jgi:MtN3 and saliva related transmembrane protein